MTTWAYLRVSTDKQDAENQRQAIKEYCAQEGMKVDDEIAVTMSSRKSTKDRRIEELLNRLKRDDYLIVSELSRIGRSVGEVAQTVDKLIAKKVNFIAIKQGIRINGKKDIATKTIITMFSLMAEIERDLISERTKQGLAVAKIRLAKEGKKLGNPNLKNMNTTNKAQAEEFAENLRPVLTGLIQQGLSQRKIVEQLNSTGIPARRGGRWSLIQLQNVMKRIDLKTSSRTAISSYNEGSPLTTPLQR